MPGSGGWSGTLLPGASASFLTPVGTPVNLMVHGAGRCQFAGYWRLDLPVALLIALLVAPLYRPF